jgi:hypothetical protein
MMRMQPPEVISNDRYIVSVQKGRECDRPGQEGGHPPKGSSAEQGFCGPIGFEIGAEMSENVCAVPGLSGAVDTLESVSSMVGVMSQFGSGQPRHACRIFRAQQIFLRALKHS